MGPARAQARRRRAPRDDPAALLGRAGRGDARGGAAAVRAGRLPGARSCSACCRSSRPATPSSSTTRSRGSRSPTRRGRRCARPASAARRSASRWPTTSSPRWRARSPGPTSCRASAATSSAPSSSAGSGRATPGHPGAAGASPAWAPHATAVLAASGRAVRPRLARLAALPDLLRERILVLDGAMGTMLQAYGFGEADFRGERFRDHPRDLRGNSDLLCLTQPAAVAAIHAGLPRRRRGHPQHELVHRDPHRPGRLRLRPGDRPRAERRGRAARPRRRRRRRARRARPPALRGRLARPDEPDRLDERRTSAIRPPAASPGTSSQVAYRESAAGLIEGGADILLIETIFDTLNAKAAIFAVQSLFDETRRAAAADHLGDDRRRLGPDAVGPDRRGVLAQHPPRRPADRRAQLRARAAPAPRAPRRPVARRRPAGLGLPERRPAERARRLRRDARGDGRGARRVGPARPAQRRRQLLRVDAGPRRRDRRGGRRPAAAPDPGAEPA